MSDFEYINDLLDFYIVLLTEKQQEIMNYYYRENYSLSEISKLLAISKTAVADTIKRSNKIILDFESKLQLLSKFKQRYIIYETLEKNFPALVTKLKNID